MYIIYKKTDGAILGIFPDDAEIVRVLNNWQDSAYIQSTQEIPFKDMFKWYVNPETEQLAENPTLVHQFKLTEVQS